MRKVSIFSVFLFSKIEQRMSQKYEGGLKTGSLSSLAFQNDEQELKVAKQRETWVNALRNEKTARLLDS